MKKILLALLCAVSLQSLAIDSKEFFKCTQNNLVSGSGGAFLFSFLSYMFYKARRVEKHVGTQAVLRGFAVFTAGLAGGCLYQLYTCSQTGIIPGPQSLPY